MSNKFIPNFDLLFKGGRVIDPANEIDGHFDVGISGTIIGAVEKDIDPSKGRKVVIPQFSDRKDEINDLAVALKNMFLPKISLLSFIQVICVF